MSELNYIIRVAAASKPVIPRSGSQTDFQRRVSLAVDTLGSGSAFPVGAIIGYPAGLNAPSGWLLCDGSAVARRSFPALYALMGDRYGAGDGSTTFNLPDFRGTAPTPEATPPAQDITGTAVAVPTTPGGSGQVGGSGGNISTGGRPSRNLDENLP